MRILFTCMVLCLTVLWANGQDTVIVDNAYDFMDACQSSHRVVIVDKDIQLSSIPWGKDWKIEGVEELKIIGKGEKRVRITTGLYDRAVIRMEKCDDIWLENLSIGHWPEVGGCEGSVLDISRSNAIHLLNVDLFGSGVIGINATRSQAIHCTNSVIRECSSSIYSTDWDSDLQFFHCKFYHEAWEEGELAGARFTRCSFFFSDKTTWKENYSTTLSRKPLELTAGFRSREPAWDDTYRNQTGDFENHCPKTVKVTTSSRLATQGENSYGANNLLELPMSGPPTAWVEGAKGAGIGQTIDFQVVALQASYEVWGLNSEFVMVNGYAKDRKTWTANSRVKSFKVLHNGHHIANVSVADSPGMQEISLWRCFENNRIRTGDTVTFEITGIYPGEKYEDTAISLLVPTCSP